MKTYRREFYTLNLLVIYYSEKHLNQHSNSEVINLIVLYNRGFGPMHLYPERKRAWKKTEIVSVPILDCKPTCQKVQLYGISYQSTYMLNTSHQ